MQIQFFKPNPRNTGHACSFYLSPKDNRFYGCLIKQDGWNAAKRTGSFAQNVDNPQKKVNVKFSNTEIGGILDSLETNREFSAYHDGATTQFSTSIKFAPYMKDGAQVGYSFMVTKSSKEDSTNKTSFVIGLSFPEGRLLREYLSFLLKKSFEAEIANFNSSLNQKKNESATQSSGQSVEAATIEL